MTRRSALRPVDTPGERGRASDSVRPIGSAGPDAAARRVDEARVERPWSPVSAFRGTSSFALVAAGLIAGGFIILLVALSGERSTVASRPAAPTAAEQPGSTSAQPVAVATPNACPSIGSWLEVIATYERQARWGLAASSAQTVLRTPGLCQQDRLALGQKAVALGREALFEQPPAPEDAPGQRRVVGAYTDLKALATQSGVPSPAALPIARSAYDSRLFLLASAAFADAFISGETSAEDREVVRAAYAAQRNIGLIWSQRTDAAQRQEGLARLATACRIDERDRLGSPEACDDLRTLLGPREKWPAPLPDPLIDTLPPPAWGRGL